MLWLFHDLSHRYSLTPCQNRFQKLMKELALNVKKS